MLDMTITGATEVEALFNRLEKKEAAKITRKGVRDVAKSTILPAAKSNAQSIVGGETGVKLAKNMTVRTMTKLHRGHYGSKVIIKPDDAFVHITKGGQRYYIPNAIEYGHAFPGRGGRKNAPKDVPPMPFMRKTYEQNRKKAITYLAIRMRILLEEAVGRLK